MSDTNKQAARAFFASLTAGDLPDDLLAPGFTAWTTTRGEVSGAAYQGGVRMLGTLFNGGLHYSIVSLTAEDDRVAVEVRAQGMLNNGEEFANIYMFLLKIRHGRISSVAEHFNPQPVTDKIMPLLQSRAAK